jgi:uncharacterized membrane protein
MSWPNSLNPLRRLAPLSPWARYVALIAHLALIVGLLAFSRSDLGRGFALLLFLPLWGLVRGAPRTHAWASMMLAFYCAMLLSNGYAEPPQRGLMFGLAAVAALEFSALVLYVRLRAREQLAVRAATPGSAAGDH